MGNQPTKQAKRFQEWGDRASEREEYQAAATLYLQARSLLQKHNKKTTPKTRKQAIAKRASLIQEASCLDRLSKAHWRLGEIEEALGFSKESLAIKDREAQGTETLARSLNDLGCLFYERGEVEKGHFLLEAALSIRESSEPGSTALAVCCNNIAIVLREMGRDSEAQERDEQARAIKEKKCPNSSSMVMTNVSLAVNARSYKVALHHLEKARELTRRMKPQPPKTLLATVENTEGSVLMMTKGGASKAIQHFERAVALEESVAGDSLALASMCNNLCEAYTRVGRHEEAREARVRSLGIRQRKAPMLLERESNKK